MKKYWLSRISEKLGLFVFTPLTTIPELKKYLLERYNYVPNNLGKLDNLESLACFFGVKNAKMKVTFSEPLKTQKPRKDLKRRLDLNEIKRLKTEGETISTIAKIAGVSRQRIFTICQNI